MKTTETVIGEKICKIYTDDTPEYIIIQPTGEHELERLDEEVKMLRQNTDKQIAFASFRITDWNQELSPWRAKQAFGEECFGDGAELTLKYVSDSLIPELPKHIEVGDDTKYILGGYSLAGLFSLWSAYQTNLFHAVAACSPSVWIDGWKDYTECHEPLIRHIYLSLGTKEHKTRNPVLRTVKEAVTHQYELLIDAGVDATLEWNVGNHFQDNTERLVKGFLWCIGS